MVGKPGPGSLDSADLAVELLSFTAFPGLDRIELFDTKSSAGNAPQAEGLVTGRTVVGMSDFSSIMGGPATPYQPWLSKDGFSVEAFCRGAMAEYVEAHHAPPEQFTILVAQLSSPCLFNRMLAIAGLERLGTEEAKRALQGATGDNTSLGAYLEGQTVSSFAAQALKRLRGEP